ncbi:MAG: D-sedoheptulose 7-phosphate isomerase [Spirochaetia bacterium]|nr:D-sedoheptulose 7-phosphate isomerase [Spirochaetia bacterium]
MKGYFEESVKESIEVKKKSYEALKESLEKTVEIIVNALKNGNKILIFGNGGSAADAQHIAAEFVVRLKLERKAYPAIALTTDTSIITACGNDYGFDIVYKRQVEALGNKGDIAVAISTSGNSKNVLLAVQEARARGMVIIGFTGEGGGAMSQMADILIDVKSKNTMRIQETHIMFLHTICDMTERKLASK